MHSLLVQALARAVSAAQCFSTFNNYRGHWLSLVLAMFDSGADFSCNILQFSYLPIVSLHADLHTCFLSFLDLGLTLIFKLSCV